MLLNSTRFNVLFSHYGVTSPWFNTAFMRILTTGKFLGHTSISFSADDVIISKTAYYKPVFEGWHCHEHHHITLLLKGGNKEQRSKTNKEVKAGDLLVYNSGEKHKNTNTRHPSVNINLEIPESFFKNKDLHFQLLQDSGSLHAKAKYNILQLFNELQINDGCSSLAINSLLYNIFLDNVAAAKQTPSWVTPLQHLLHDRWNESPSLQEIAAELNLHPVTVSKYFPVYFKESLSNYLRRIKIDRALILIQNRNKSLTEVAYECGFFDQSHFIKAFKSFAGMTPSQFRQLL